MSIENRTPQVELPPDYPVDITLRLQDEQFLNKARDFGSRAIPPYVTSLTKPSESLYTLDLTAPGAWVFGNEGQDASPEL